MPTTASHAIPYPQGIDSVTVPAHMQALADKVDTELDAIAPDQITGPTAGQILIANATGVVTGVAMSGDGTISPAGDFQIGAGKVGTAELADLAATTAKIDNASVTSAKIVDGTIVNADIAAAAAIAESKLTLASDAAAGTASRRTLGTGATQAAAGTDSRLSDQRVPTDGSVTSAKIATGAVTNGKLAGNIDLSKLTPSGYAAQIPIAALGTGIPTYQYLSGDVSVDHTGVATIGAGAVTENKIGAGQVTGAKLQLLGVATGHIADSAITPNKIADDAVTKDKIAPSSLQGKIITVSGATGASAVTWDTAMAGTSYVCVATAYVNGSTTTLGISSKTTGGVFVSWAGAPATVSFEIHLIAMLLG